MRQTALFACVVAAVGCLAPGPPADPSGVVVAAEQRLTPPEASASEVAIAVSPADPRVVVAAANSGGGFGVYRSTDAGDSWTAGFFGPADVAAAAAGAPRYRQLSDPALAFGPDGALYLAGLAYLPTSAVFVARSPDGGATWPQVAVVEESDPASSFNDKEWIGVSPETGTVLVAWQKELLVDQLRDVEARTGLDLDFGDIVVSRSTDGGMTWTEPAIVSRGRHNNGTQVAFTGDGRAHLLWVNYEGPALDAARSDDDGATWSAPAEVARIVIAPAYERYARMHTLPALAAAPNGTALYAVWHDARNGDVDVYAVASADGGASWGEPVRASGGEPADGVEEIYPWAAVDPAGRLHVAYYGARDDPARPLFRYWHRAADGPGLAFGPETVVSSEPFTAFAARGAGPTSPDTESRSLGDYTGLAAGASGVFAAWADGRGDAAAVWAARITTP